MRLKTVYDMLTYAERRAADYIIANPAEAMNLSVQELAQRADTSPATVMRMAGKAGYESFPALKIDLARNYEREPAEDFIIDIEDTPSDITHKLSSIFNDISRDMADMIDPAVSKLILDKISTGRKIYILGSVGSSIAAKDLHYKLMRIDKDAIYNEDSQLQLIVSALSTKEDVVIAFSYRGETEEVLKPVRQHKKNGAYVIAVTGCFRSELAGISDTVINIPGFEGDFRLGSIASRYAQLFVSDFIFLGVTQGDFDNAKRRILDTRNAVLNSAKHTVS